MVACAFAPQLHLSGVQRLRRTRASYPRMQSAEKALQRTPHFFMARLLRLGWVTGKVEESTTAWKQPDQSDSFRRGDLRGVTVRALSAQELSEGSKLEIVARLCVSGMFGVEKEDGSSWVLRNFNVKYGEDSASGRQSVMLVAETDDGEIVGCCGMELMLLTEQGMGWYTKNNPGSIVKKRPFVSDLVVDTTYRRSGLGSRMLMKCHEIVMGEWAQEIQGLTPAQRLDWDIERVFLKVDSENTGAVKLYKKLGYKEVARIAEELMVPKSPTSVSEWPVLNIYMQREMQRDMRPFPPLRSFAFNMSR